MKQLILTVAALFAFAFFLAGCGSDYESARTNLSTKTDSLSYSFGYLQGSNLAAEGIYDIDFENYIAGLVKGLDEEEAEIDNMAMQTLIQTFFQDLQTQQMERRASEAETHVQQGRAFLEENLQNSDVNETDSGLQYRVLEEGDGDVRPSASDEVTVHYRGTLLNDEEFDSSYERGDPATFPLNRVIPGWTEGVQLMTVGSRYQFFIPADLAYGNDPPPGSIIPPGAVLIFEVELLEIN
ncbi:MAG: FKBP-type peptidyl-prolyl cis-trans isomerase [Balneolaceae bacterium]|nr:FKBP-type peptidyl-prolyl cis-trans isomerase [Balneolaceae bacterium]